MTDYRWIKEYNGTDLEWSEWSGFKTFETKKATEKTIVATSDSIDNYTLAMFSLDSESIIRQYTSSTYPSSKYLRIEGNQAYIGVRDTVDSINFKAIERINLSDFTLDKSIDFSNYSPTSFTPDFIWATDFALTNNYLIVAVNYKKENSDSTLSNNSKVLIFNKNDFSFIQKIGEKEFLNFNSGNRKLQFSAVFYDSNFFYISEQFDEDYSNTSDDTKKIISKYNLSDFSFNSEIIFTNFLIRVLDRDENLDNTFKPGFFMAYVFGIKVADKAGGEPDSYNNVALIKISDFSMVNEDRSGTNIKYYQYIPKEINANGDYVFYISFTDEISIKKVNENVDFDIIVNNEFSSLFVTNGIALVPNVGLVTSSSKINGEPIRILDPEDLTQIRQINVDIGTTEIQFFET